MKRMLRSDKYTRQRCVFCKDLISEEDLIIDVCLMAYACVTCYEREYSGSFWSKPSPWEQRVKQVVEGYGETE